MIHWHRVLKPIRDSGNEGASRGDIAEAIGVESNDPELAESLGYLISKQKIIAAMGATDKGGVVIVYQLPQPRRSRRDEILVDPVEHDYEFPNVGQPPTTPKNESSEPNANPKQDL